MFYLQSIVSEQIKAIDWGIAAAYAAYMAKGAQVGKFTRLRTLELAIFILRTLRGGLRNMEEMSLQYAFQHIKNELQLIFVSAVRCPFCYVSFFMLKALGIELEDSFILTSVVASCS